ncbi:MAG: glycosyltransferase [Ruminococcus sp.]|nr:glycosyltransferase [Ruminococcus sp.]
MSKKNKKIKLFLGAYVNFPNAQNINCDHIARYIDKEKFEVHTMYTDKMPINKQEYKKLGIHLHRLIHHRFIWYWCKWLTMFFGKYDIYYLPKTEPMDWSFAKLFKGKKCKFVGSVEGVVTDTENNSPEFIYYYTKLMDNSFAISKCIAESVKEKWKYDMPVLPLGVDPMDIEFEHKECLKNIIWVGNIKANKRPMYLIECAKRFPSINFTMIGDGDIQDAVKEEIRKHNLQNVKLTGRISNSKVYENMRKNDLFLMTSKNEGLPKVIQEAAQCGLPSIYIGECYDVDFIESGINGIKVMNLEEMIEKIQFLIDNPEKLQNMSQNAIESVQEYLWPNLIKDYEHYFTKVYNENKGQNV